MLYLVGMGLNDERDISLRGLDAMKGSDIIFVDRYTNIIDESALKNLESLRARNSR